MAAINLFTRFVKNSLQTEFGHKICSFIQFRQIIEHIIFKAIRTRRNTYSDHVILSAVQPETVANRLNDRSNEEDEDELDEE